MEIIIKQHENEQITDPNVLAVCDDGKVVILNG